MMENQESVGSYSPLTGFVFIFNLIVGAGALTIPHAFANVGLAYGSVALSVLASVSYVTATFMIEAIAGVNALKRCKGEMGANANTDDDDKRSLEELNDSDDNDVLTEFVPLMEHDALQKNLRTKASERKLRFDLSKKVELAEMAELLFSHRGVVAFYACITVYLYGDLAIYAVAVPKSLREMICPRPSADAVVWACSDECNSSELYRLFVVLFGLLLGPFTFGHVHKTRTLQLVSTVVRHASFGLMIVLASVGIARGHGRSVADVVSYEKPSNIATFFGVCIYSFMCHHSVPGLVAPITNKSKVGTVLISAFMAVLSVYFVLCASATFRFKPEDVQDVYTLNFKNYPVHAFGYFLSLFPVFTLSASFPLICITLRENIRHLASRVVEASPATNASAPRGLYGLVQVNTYALVALLPPLVVAFFTEDVSMLVGFTGTYAGLGIQWLVPTCLVYCLRNRLAVEWQQQHPMEGELSPTSEATPGPKNRYASPFVHDAWLYVVLGFSLVSVVLVTITHGML
uniref:Amino acid transporter transmembrane domain-containing protein n=1 Tax=Peronospora matthiolae TaxID=2874970 RepID=A0AAV1T5E8_9STRA